MQQLEARLEEHFYKSVRRVGARSFKLAPTMAGMPDRMVVFPGGIIYLVELKTVHGALSEIQQHQHGLLAELGVKVHVLHGRDSIDQWIRWALDEMHEIRTMATDIEKRRERRRRKAQ